MDVNIFFKLVFFRSMKFWRSQVTIAKKASIIQNQEVIVIQSERIFIFKSDGLTLGTPFGLTLRTPCKS